MTTHVPFITDPQHLAEVAGTAYVVVRPNGEVVEAFDAVQRRVREVVGDDGATWPAAHLTLKGFGTRERPIDHGGEKAIASLVRAWASETPPFEVRVEAFDVFPEDRIPIVRISRTAELGLALGDLRSRAAIEGLQGHEDFITPEDWIFHLSIGYVEEERWPTLEAALNDLSVSPASCTADAVELVGFDGGPERLIGRFPLLGG
jgi:2'-5' RNA ligase